MSESDAFTVYRCRECRRTKAEVNNWFKGFIVDGNPGLKRVCILAFEDDVDGEKPHAYLCSPGCSLTWASKTLPEVRG
jgi:hypothetical protein